MHKKTSGNYEPTGKIAPLPALFRIRSIQGFQFFPQRFAINAENIGCPRFVSVQAGQNIPDVLDFDFGQGPVQSHVPGN